MSQILTPSQQQEQEKKGGRRRALLGLQRELNERRRINHIRSGIGSKSSSKHGATDQRVAGVLHEERSWGDLENHPVIHTGTVTKLMKHKSCSPSPTRCSGPVTLCVTAAARKSYTVLLDDGDGHHNIPNHTLYKNTSLSSFKERTLPHPRNPRSAHYVAQITSSHLCADRENDLSL